MTKPIDGAAKMIMDLDWKVEYLVALDVDAVSRGAKEAGMQEVGEDLASPTFGESSRISV